MSESQNELAQEALALCHAIEMLPASEKQTEVSLKASALYRKLRGALVPPDYERHTGVDPARPGGDFTARATVCTEHHCCPHCRCACAACDPLGSTGG